MSSEALLIIVLMGGALLIVVLNDWWKRQLVSRAKADRREIRQDWLVNKTQWGRVGVLAVVGLIYVYLMNHPELTDRDFGPLNPLVEWLFRKPR